MTDWARGEADRLVAEARAEALAEARARLKERYVAELLAAASAHDVAPETTAPVAPAEPVRETAPAANPRGTGAWVYGVVRADAPAPEGIAGVDGEHPVELVSHGELAAVISAVPLDTFGEEALRAGLEDLGRVEALARAHERVVEAALAAAGSVVPFRLCTIYTDAGHVREMLGREAEALGTALDRVEGATEWGVKAYARPTAATTGGADPDSGTGYLRARREAREAAEAAWEEIGLAVEDVHARLAEQASATALGRPQDRRLSGHDGEMVLNAAYLVPAERTDRFRELVADLAERHTDDGLLLELTGPWPPYHFAAEAPAP